MADGNNADAEALFTRTWNTSSNRFGSVFSFREVARIGLKSAKEEVHATSVGFVTDMFTNPKYDDLFLDKEAALDAVGGLDEQSRLITEQKVKTFQAAVDAASLVFAHSILDGAAMEYCRVAASVSPESWDDFIGKRKVEIQEIKASSYDDVRAMTLGDYLNGLERESVLKKIDLLFAICKPPEGFAPINEYSFDRNRVLAIDKIRHEIVHGEPVEEPLPAGDDDIWFLMSTANFLMSLLNHKFDLKIDPYQVVGATRSE